jgi:hypothetical protein
MHLLAILGEGEAAMTEVRGYGLEEIAEFRSTEESPGDEKGKPLLQ